MKSFVICEECKKTGRKSSVRFGRPILSTLPVSEFYDEEGKIHFHDPNSTRTEFVCSNNHDWVEMEKSACWCGFNG